MDGVKDARPKFDQPKFDNECRLMMPPVAENNHDDHTLESCKAKFTDPRSFNRPAPDPKLPDSDVDPVAAMSRDVLRAQSELIAKYAAHCESKTSTCSNVATLLDYTRRVTLAREIALIYFRAATLEV